MISGYRPVVFRSLSRFNLHFSFHSLRQLPFLPTVRCFQAKTSPPTPLPSEQVCNPESTPTSSPAMTSIALPHNIDASPLFLPPQLVPHPESITRLAVYGTLRDDDDSGASWTSSFIANRTSACSGVVRGAKLYWAHKLK